MTTTWNHAFTIGYSLESKTADGSDVTAEMVREALMKRIKDLDDNNEWNEVLEVPFDTYEVD